ncbi:hypothetical protein THRCLA_08000, partial [Thraustotheca clavata]
MIKGTVLLSMLLPLVTSQEIFARDGNGKPVAWWMVVKLPSQVRDASGNYIDTPCDCASPACSIADNTGRQHGLCYLYADTNNPQLRYFKDIGYDCLGQGGRDPLSQTIKQKQNATYWAYFNDQLNGISQSIDESRVCGGQSLFNAHSKGMTAFETGTGGFVLQTSTPNYPDPTPSDQFVPLGCQNDNNVQYAQHLFAMSVDDQALKTIASGWQSARLCSANYYHTMQNMLLSPSLAKLKLPVASPVLQFIYDALVNPRLATKQSVQLTWNTKVAPVKLSGLFKSHTADVPPWALVASTFNTDVSVASWWDEGYGIPTLCDGDIFSSAKESFCLNQASLNLRKDGTFQYNVENLIDATWSSSTSDKITWSLRGGQVRDGNHGKWGIATPRDKSFSNTVFFGDLNMEGFPCSTQCSGSQGGRGGTMYSINTTELHTSLVGLITNACQC